MKDKNNLHYSVLKEESIKSLELVPGLIVVDATVNRAGHASEIAKIIGNTGTIIIFDLDKAALDYSKKKLESLENAPTVIAFHTNYRNIKECLESIEKEMKVDRIFADLGLSSQELEISGRGFTFQKDEPLYMTFQSEVGENTFTAMDLINNLSVTDLEKIFKVYGDEPYAWKIANAIVEAREQIKEETNSLLNPSKIKVKKIHDYPIKTTKQLAEIIESVVPRRGKTHPATKVFQAIRIAVNDEFESIKEFVNTGYELLNHGGILSIITFHSGEDRIVKNMFSFYAKASKDKQKMIKIKPTRKEVLENKRSRSAILRTIKKL
jgi:16S rRNA (cytosine1402-N4)-methyltransferase